MCISNHLLEGWSCESGLFGTGKKISQFNMLKLKDFPRGNQLIRGEAADAALRALVVQCGALRQESRYHLSLCWPGGRDGEIGACSGQSIPVRNPGHCALFITNSTRGQQNPSHIRNIQACETGRPRAGPCREDIHHVPPVNCLPSFVRMEGWTTRSSIRGGYALLTVLQQGTGVPSSVSRPFLITNCFVVVRARKSRS